MPSWFSRMIFPITSTAFIVFLMLGCKDTITDNNKTTEHKMYVYSNSGNIFYLIDYQNFQVLKEIHLTVSDTAYCHGMTLSTNRDHLFFRAGGPSQQSRFGFVIYDIVQEKQTNFYLTDLRTSEPAYSIAADNPSAPGLIYIQFRDAGMYSIDLLQQKVQEKISNESDFSLRKQIYHSSDGRWDIVFKEWNLLDSYTELEFYNKGSMMHDLQFVFNRANKDSIQIDDFIQTIDNKLYVTYLLSGGRSRDIACYLGLYDLQTKQFSSSLLALPWSLNPYYMAYCAARNEIYTIGENDKFYVIDAGSSAIKKIITLSGKIKGPSRIVVHPDNNIAFVSCSSTDVIFLIDLQNQAIISTINVKSPYTMIIP